MSSTIGPIQGGIPGAQETSSSTPAASGNSLGSHLLDMLTKDQLLEMLANSDDPNAAAATVLSSVHNTGMSKKQLLELLSTASFQADLNKRAQAVDHYEKRFQPKPVEINCKPQPSAVDPTTETVKTLSFKQRIRG